MESNWAEFQLSVWLPAQLIAVMQVKLITKPTLRVPNTNPSRDLSKSSDIFTN